MQANPNHLQLVIFQLNSPTLVRVYEIPITEQFIQTLPPRVPNYHPLKQVALTILLNTLSREGFARLKEIHYELENYSESI